MKSENNMNDKHDADRINNEKRLDLNILREGQLIKKITECLENGIIQMNSFFSLNRYASIMMI